MAFGQPIFLWCFAAILIPVAIHLIHQKDARVLYVGSLRHLTSSISRKSRAIGLNHLLLLFLRILLISIFALILSESIWNSSSALPKWILFEGGTLADSKIQIIRDSLEKAGYESRSLSSGFPLLKDSSNSQEQASYWTLANELTSIPLSDVIVFSWMKSERFRGKKVALPINQHWIPVDTREQSFIAQAVRVANDSLQITTGHSDNMETYFDTKLIKYKPLSKWFQSGTLKDSIAIRNSHPKRVQLITDDFTTQETKVVQASLMAIKSIYPASIATTISKPNDLLPAADFYIWLSATPIPTTVRDHCIAVQEQISAPQLLNNESGKWVLTKHVTQELANDEDLPIHLADIFLKDWQADSLVRKKDERVMPSSMLWSPVTVNNNNLADISGGVSDSQQSLFFLLLIVLLAERIISWRQNQ